MIKPLLLMLALVSAGQPDWTTSAEAFISQYQDLYWTFDPKVVELYADDAVIINRRVLPGQDVTSTMLSGAEYKALLLSSLEMARQRGGPE